MNSEKERSKNISCTEEYHSRPWADLDDNLLRDIFRRLSTKELFLVVSLVCRSWRSVCWDVMFWKDEETLDLTNLCTFLPAVQKKSWKIPSNALKSVVDPPALDFDQRSIKTIIFYKTDWSFPCHDFTFLAERSPGLKRLMMPRPCAANLNFLPVLRSWKHVEEISLGRGGYVRTWGTKCNYLNMLHLGNHYHLSVPASVLILTYLPQLEVFTMDDCSVAKNEILLIFSFCMKLSCLCFMDCPIFQYSDPTRPRRRSPRVPRRCITAIIEKINMGKNIGWSIGNKLFSSKEILDHLFDP